MKNGDIVYAVHKHELVGFDAEGRYGEECKTTVGLYSSIGKAIGDLIDREAFTGCVEEIGEIINNLNTCGCIKINACTKFGGTLTKPEVLWYTVERMEVI